ncbi:MAG: MotA/TolQ/ExbB proton channel family protein [Fuerstiella sp.]
MSAFYACGLAVPGLNAFVDRYFCSHPLEYISAAMFFVGMAILVQKYGRLRSERNVLTAASQLARRQLAAAATPSDREALLSEWCRTKSAGASTHLVRRIQDTLQYLRGSRRDGLEEHLRYLAELASDRLHQTYATIRTITWAIPILGFLGTVIGITMAIGNVTPEQLDSSLGEVTGGLSVAFDTTALALGMSIVLVFASFVVERGEQKVLSDVEQFGIETLLPGFGGEPAQQDTQSSQSVLPADFIRQQCHLWAEQLTSFRITFSEVLEHHAVDLKDAMDADLEQTLHDHRDASSDARDAWNAALQESTQTVVGQVERVLGTFEDRMLAWQQAMQSSSQESARQSEALHQLGATLLRLTESEERLAALQKQLNQNLQALQVAETMERTANSLTAAVHVLTAKTSMRNAA